MRHIAIVLCGVDGMDLLDGKPKMAWSCIQAASSKYLHETWVAWAGGTVTGPDFIGELIEGDPVKQVLAMANSQPRDGVDIVVVLDASKPLRALDAIDLAVDQWLEDQDKRIVADGMWLDASKKILSGVAILEKALQVKPPAELSGIAYYEYIRDTLTEVGYVNHSGKYNRAVAETKLPWEYRFSFFNHYGIFRELQEKRAADINAEKRQTAEPALIIGSGSSLDDALPLLKDWRGPIVCSSAQASTILYHGFTGKLYIMVFDIWTRKLELDWMGDVEGKDVTLISHPGVNPELLAAWKGKKLYYRCMDLSNFFFSEVLPAGYDQIKTSMLLFASSAAAQMSIANAMGLSPLFLVGVDFSLMRFTKWIKNGEGWKAEPDIDPVPTKPIRASNGIWTDPLQIFYKVSALTVYRIDHCQCINTSDRSAISEMPTADLREVIAKQGLGFESVYRTPQQIEDTIETYLASRNNFMVRFINGGCRAVETGSTDEGGWKRDITSYMVNVNGQSVRGGEGEIIDVQANVSRFEWLKERCK